MTDKTEIEQVRRAYEHYKECCNRLPLDVEATKALQEKLERLENGGWLPIESAPKSGRRILMYPCNNSGYYIQGQRLFKDGWYGDDGLNRNPTHWQPLPPAPKQGEK